jgi:hypothetical protein
MKLHKDIAQNSTEWMILRSGKVTASECDALVSPTGKVRTGEGPKTYLHKKLAEAWLGGPLPSVQGVFDLEQGKILEEYAKPAFTIETGLEIEDVGFITGDNELVGCSPDGIVKGHEIGCEIKCPQLPTHIGYLLSGALPSDYIIQVQFSLFVTGFKKWMFFSYRRNLPPLILTVEPDTEIQESIEEAVGNFELAFRDGLEKLVEINGGEPDKRFRGIAPFPKRDQPSAEMVDYKV